jgi:EAL domain-containing protein (putative c-di-GMP-specific phosphodiesterase class I)
MGIAIFPTDSNSVEDLLKFSDSALYLAKNEGRNNFQFYSADLSAKSSERMRIETSLRKALQNNEFILHYQTQVNLQSRDIIGVEALIRWQPANSQMIPPDKFISIAENCGLIIEIGKWVITTACIAAVKWNWDRPVPIPVSINLSTRQFIQNDLEGSIRNILGATGCKPSWIKLEITESLLLENNEKVQNTLLALHNFGLQISMDDFGTGYSSLSYLNQFPISQLKIDRSFVKDITSDVDRGLLVNAIISMAISLRKTLIAEGVETEEQAIYLAENGCSYAQGYLFSKPAPFESFTF